MVVRRLANGPNVFGKWAHSMTAVIAFLILFLPATAFAGCQGQVGCGDGLWYHLEQNGVILNPPGTGPSCVPGVKQCLRKAPSRLTIGWCQKARDHFYPTAVCVPDKNQN